MDVALLKEATYLIINSFKYIKADFGSLFPFKKNSVYLKYGQEIWSMNQSTNVKLIINDYV